MALVLDLTALAEPVSAAKNFELATVVDYIFFDFSSVSPGTPVLGLGRRYLYVSFQAGRNVKWQSVISLAASRFRKASRTPRLMWVLSTSSCRKRRRSGTTACGSRSRFLAIPRYWSL